MALGIDILILIILLILSGFFSGAEVALVSLSKAKVRQLVEEKQRSATTIERLKDDPHRMLSTILFGNNVVNVASSAYATAIALSLFDSYAIGIVTGVMTFLILVFGEITPKSIAVSYNVFFAKLVAPVIWYLSVLLGPILFILDGFIKRLMKLFGLKVQEETVSEEEIKNMIQAAQDEGAIKEAEKTMLHNIFEFDDMNVEEIATPRNDIGMVESTATIEKAVKSILRRNFSRAPVFQKTHDNIVGMVYVKELIPYLGTSKAKWQIKKVMKKPYIIPETKKISNLLRQFQKRKEHMAVVVDEHGVVTGLVTLEDVLEEIVGEIMDETDKVDPCVRKLGKNAWEVRGKTDIDEINEKLKMKLKGEDYDTFSGFIVKYTGHIPKQKDEIMYKKFKITIKEIAKNRVELAKVEKNGKITKKQPNK